MHAHRWHLPELHLARALRPEHVHRAAFAALAVMLAAACAHAAVTTDVVAETHRFAAQPYWWFLENVTAYCAGGFNR